ncbi:(S)-2-haloacid dehalogenase 4A [Vanrija pseudolonga]|uniref:(S)-2-haloacid dehalogenase 4A n=1 Tax=Vanrija pseudolonga TaxID=143232 RepID=A0AAF0Y970_9TREE|nr:(S)-2-haloacid dehalogenase 4A [Vanrija pseudolonga]
MSTPSKDYKALLFDCYGTLINWEGGMQNALQPLLVQIRKQNISRDDFFKQLGSIETAIQTNEPTKLYPDVLAETYRQVADHFKLQYTEDEAVDFGNSVPEWPAFPDSAKALKRLQDSGLKLVILSNINNDSFAASRKKLEKEGAVFDEVYTAQNIGSYKPSLNNFDYAISHLQKDHGISKDEILIVANSKLHDIQPGHKVGLKGAWIDRAGGVMGVSAFTGVEPAWTYDSMREFADVIEKVRA